jgi:hypothetical protein
VCCLFWAKSGDAEARNASHRVSEVLSDAPDGGRRMGRAAEARQVGVSHLLGFARFRLSCMNVPPDYVSVARSGVPRDACLRLYSPVSARVRLSLPEVAAAAGAVSYPVSPGRCVAASSPLAQAELGRGSRHIRQ